MALSKICFTEIFQTQLLIIFIQHQEVQHELDYVPNLQFVFVYTHEVTVL